MKIGIVTFHNADNYGALLQCHALYKTVARLFPQDSVQVADYRSPSITSGYRLLYFQRIEKFSIPRNFVSWIFQFVYVPQRAKWRRNFRSFRKNFLEIGSGNLDDYDLLIYGSDQIWNFTLTQNDFTFMGENFSGKKIAYGASDGGFLCVDEKIKNFLRGFSAVFCRENSLTKKIEPFFPGAKTVLDPVFLPDSSEWKKIAVPPKQKNYVLVYQISENNETIPEAKKLALATGKKVVEIVYVLSVRKWFVKGQKFFVAASPREFLGFFENASFVVTTSFHGTAFSIVFRKNFYVMKFNRASERITDLLRALNLENRFVEKIPVENSEEKMKIDYDAVQENLNRLKNESLNLLAESICSAGGGGRNRKVVPSVRLSLLTEAA